MSPITSLNQLHQFSTTPKSLGKWQEQGAKWQLLFMPLPVTYTPVLLRSSPLTCMAVLWSSPVTCMSVFLRSSLAQCYFSFIPDESTDVAVLEQVAVGVWVFDNSSGKVNSLLFVEYLTAAEKFAAMEKVFMVDSIPWLNIVMGILVDVANVQCGKCNSVIL